MQVSVCYKSRFVFEKISILVEFVYKHLHKWQDLGYVVDFRLLNVFEGAFLEQSFKLLVYCFLEFD